MENAVDALKMAAAILVFMIALAISFSLFGTAKQTADSIIGMRDKQAYLESAEEDVEGILYTSSSAIKGDESVTDITTEFVSGVTKNGDRVVSIEDVISTIYRYSKEKYGVTIVKKTNGEVIARYDSNTESVMATYDSITSGFAEYKSKLEENTETDYVNPKFDNLAELYRLKTGGYGVPWYGSDAEIQKKINYDINGGTYISLDGKKYEGIKLLNELERKKIIEVTNEIDNSTYLKEDTDEDGITDYDTNLLQQYQLPTIEIVYIVY